MHAEPVAAAGTFAEMMALEAHGPDTFVGVGPRYPWGGLYGGQIVAQALRAAGLTVDKGYRAHSLHAYFIRRGDHDEPIRFEVDRLRNGRSFVTRAVVARQATGAILNLSASFQVDEEAFEVQAASMPDVPVPDGLVDDSWSNLFARRFADRTQVGRASAWLRLTEEVGDDPLVQSCALAYVSDDMPTDATFALHPDRRPMGDDSLFMAASLDHAVWFHRPSRPDEWQLHDFTCHGLMGSRGLAVGHIFTAGGVHVATVTQEVLMRRRTR